ncbi:hypothetical protein Tco_1093540 [Tanacetum coccineum]|uniref:Uncharacterized protein n=1 Tax=Tanacetum coccineum TaxID=301880 RepID=A0ABQ5IF15_9ASTR
MENIKEIIHVKRVGGSAYSIVDVEEIKSVELGILSSVGMVLVSVEQNQNVEGCSKVKSVDDNEQRGIVAVNDVGVAKQVRFVFEDDLGSGDTDDDGCCE